MSWYMLGWRRTSASAGLTFIEILLVVAILAILFAMVFVSIHRFSRRSQDIKIRNDVRQLRLLAEQVYDEEGANYKDWASHPDIADNVELLRNNIDAVHGDAPGEPWQSVVIDSREDEYCISAPLLAGEADFYCADASGKFFEVDSQCQVPVSGNDLVTCPAN